jgi:hypothetical protein
VTPTAGSECEHILFFYPERELTYSWNTVRTTTPNTSSTLPIFMTRIQVQVGCYRLEVFVSVAGVGEETRPLTTTNNEGAYYHFSDLMSH